MEYKTCKICGKYKPITDFYRRTTNTCKRCTCDRNSQKVYERNLKKFPDLQGEVWKDVAGFEGLYKVSNFGRVRAIGRGLRRGCIMTDKFDKLDGYMHLSLTKDGVPHHFVIHRLVAIAFIPNPDNKPTVNHKDFNRCNNRAENLEWMTQKENNRYSIEAGHRKYTEKMRLGAYNRRSVKDEVVKMIMSDYDNGLKPSEIADKYNVTRPFVSRVVHGRLRGDVTNLANECQDLRNKLSDADIIEIYKSSQQGENIASLAKRFDVAIGYIRQLLAGTNPRGRAMVKKGIIIPKEKPIPQKVLYREEIIALYSRGLSLRKIRLALGIKGHDVVAEVIKEFKDNQNGKRKENI